MLWFLKILKRCPYVLLEAKKKTENFSFLYIKIIAKSKIFLFFLQVFKLFQHLLNCL